MVTDFESFYVSFIFCSLSIFDKKGGKSSKESHYVPFFLARIKKRKANKEK